MAEQARARKERYGEIDELEEAAAKEQAKVAVELECIVCNKRFKSEAQFANHEKSKKHIENVKIEKALIDDMNESDEEGQEEETLSESEWSCAACKQKFNNEEACFIHLE